MKKVFTEKAPAAIGPYSQAVISNGIVFTSGQIAIVPEKGEIVSDTVEGQTRQVCENLSEVLAAAGSSLDKAIKTTCFLRDIGDFSKFNAIYAEYFAGKPARSCVAVKDLPKGALVEIEVIAEL
ncbi:MAG: RidA family protein [Clostridia bacterium]|nr:RidA family protein [Clostridia bacterium]